MSYWRLFYHVVWATKERELLLTAGVKPTIYQHLRNKAINLEGTLFALNGMEDHVHMIVSIPPKISVAKFVGQVKGYASTMYNNAVLEERRFFWQAEYAAFSFDSKRLPNYIAYVDKQEEHHTRRTTIPALERTDSDGVHAAGVQIVRESPNLYYVEDMAWRQELEEMVDS